MFPPVCLGVLLACVQTHQMFIAKTVRSRNSSFLSGLGLSASIILVIRRQGLLCALTAAHTYLRVLLSCSLPQCRMMICSGVRRHLPEVPGGGRMDVLSEVLKVVKLQGALFYNGEFSCPWSFSSPPSLSVAPYVAPAAGHVIIYHLLTEGRASARLVNGERIILEAGDIVIFPHGDAHFLENGPPTESVDMVKELTRIFSQGLKLSRLGGGGEVT